MNVSTLQTFPQKCAACGICELACSYHHDRSFSRVSSSIEIRKSDATGDVDIILLKDKTSSRKACDDCADEKVPLCVHWCPVGAIIIGAG